MLEKMTDPDDYEQIALDVAGDMGGAFIQELMNRNKSKVNFSEWTPEEWKDFIKTVCGGYVGQMLGMEDAAIRAASKVRHMPDQRQPLPVLGMPPNGWPKRPGDPPF